MSNDAVVIEPRVDRVRKRASAGVKVLFVTNQLGLLRHFPTVLAELDDRGHEVTVANQGRVRGKSVKLGADLRAFRVVEAPRERGDRWAPDVRALRTVRDYARWYGPDLAPYEHMRLRARGWAVQDAPGFVEMLDEAPEPQKRAAAAERAARVLERLVPSDQTFERFLAAAAPDVVLITPMIEFGSSQPDVVKAARRLGVPVGFPPFSWDNLSSKGLIRAVPDRLLAWNAVQADEAVRWHGVPADRIRLTGAPRFDDFATLKPSMDRDAYLQEMGFTEDAPIVLYLGSSPLIAPDELPEVLAWIDAVRRGLGPEPVNILLRPHPKNLAQWEAADFEDARTRIHRVPTLKDVEQPLFDALHHAAAVVGVNTSALLEAAVVRKAVLQPPRPEPHRAATLHEHYLTGEQGLLVTAGSWPEHLAHLTTALSDPAPFLERTDRFVEHFLRPCGADRRPTDVMADEIEALAGLRKRPRRAPEWQRPLGPLLRAAVRSGLTPAGRLPQS